MNGFNSDCFKDKKIQNPILDDINRDLKKELNSKKDVSLKKICAGENLLSFSQCSPDVKGTT